MSEPPQHPHDHPPATSVPPPSLVGRLLGGRYRLVSPLGVGASARVYLADDLTLGRQVAVKCLRPGLSGDRRFLRRFAAEARAAAQLSHPNLLAVYDWSDDGETPFIVTEVLLGGSLRSMLDQGILSLSQGLLVGLQAAEGLAYAHRLGWVHRDIKPANLLFGVDRRLRIADFGIARALAEASFTEPEGVLVGTARYAAPEQGDNTAVDGRADVYSLAVTVIEAVTGRVPLLRESALATLLARREEDVGVVNGLGPLGPLLAAAGRADPERRPSASALVAELARVARTMPPPQRLPLAGIGHGPDGGAAGEDTVLDLTTEGGPTAGGVGEWTSGEVTYHPIRRPAPLEIVRPLPPTNPTLELGPVGSEADIWMTLFGDATPASTGTGTGTEPTAAADVKPRSGTDRTHDDHDQEEDDGDEPTESLPVPSIGPRPLLLVMVIAVVAAGILMAAVLIPDGPGADDPSVALPVFPEVGNLIGGTLAEAEAVAGDHDWGLRSSETRRDGTELGQILEQVPDPGTRLAPGGELKVVVSLGPELRTVPGLVGRNVDEADGILGEANLAIGAVTRRHDDRVPAGDIVAMRVDGLEPGTRLETATAVDLVVSAGKPARPLPSFVGLTEARAEVRAAELDLVLSRSEEHSSTYPAGQVIDHDPATGSPVRAGDELAIVISLGPPPVTVPDVTGLDAATAADRLTGAGLVVTGTVGPPNQPVTGTDPAIGQTIPHGSTIVIRTSAG